jgi:di/tricarboxylate transporter
MQKIRGLAPATDQVFKLDAPRTNRCLIEAVVSDSFPLLGKNIREGRFRSVYQAAVIAVARNGEQLRMKIGDIVLRPGDTLLLETHPGFAARHKNSRDFFLVSRLDDSTPPSHERAKLSLGLLLGMVAAVSFGLLDMLQAAMLTAGLMIITKCINAAGAHRAVDWSVLVVIAAAFGIGQAMQVTGAADGIAQALLGFSVGDPLLALAVVFVVTAILTSLITNNAAAVLMFPVAIAMSSKLGVDFMPFIITIMIAASASFATPIGYQTNLMVYGPGGYHFSDFIKLGVPLTILIGAITIALAPMVWSF